MENQLTSNNLNIEDIKELKKEAAEEILRILHRFERKSGLDVSDLSITIIDSYSPNTPPKKIDISFKFYL